MPWDHRLPSLYQEGPAPRRHANGMEYSKINPCPNYTRDVRGRFAAACVRNAGEVGVVVVVVGVVGVVGGVLLEPQNIRIHIMNPKKRTQGFSIRFLH